MRSNISVAFVLLGLASLSLANEDTLAGRAQPVVAKRAVSFGNHHGHHHVARAGVEGHGQAKRTVTEEKRADDDDNLGILGDILGILVPNDHHTTSTSHSKNHTSTHHSTHTSSSHRSSHTSTHHSSTATPTPKPSQTRLLGLIPLGDPNEDGSSSSSSSKKADDDKDGKSNSEDDDGKSSKTSDSASATSTAPQDLGGFLSSLFNPPKSTSASASDDKPTSTRTSDDDKPTASASSSASRSSSAEDESSSASRASASASDDDKPTKSASSDDAGPTSLSVSASASESDGLGGFLSSLFNPSKSSDSDSARPTSSASASVSASDDESSSRSSTRASASGSESGSTFVPSRSSTASDEGPTSSARPSTSDDGSSASPSAPASTKSASSSSDDETPSSTQAPPEPTPSSSAEPEPAQSSSSEPEPSSTSRSDTPTKASSSFYDFVPTSTLLIDTQTRTTSSAAEPTDAPSSSADASSTSSSAAPRSSGKVVLQEKFPTQIVPADTPVTPVAEKEDTTLISILFRSQINWQWLCQSADLQGQIFAFLPSVISNAVQVNASSITTDSLQAYTPAGVDPSNKNAVLSVYLAYIPTGAVDTLQAQMLAPNSALYTGATGVPAQLAQLIDPSLNLLAYSQGGANNPGTGKGGSISDGESSSGSGGMSTNMKITIAFSVIGGIAALVVAFLLFKKVRQGGSTFLGSGSASNGSRHNDARAAATGSISVRSGMRDLHLRGAARSHGTSPSSVSEYSAYSSGRGSSQRTGPWPAHYVDNAYEREQRRRRPDSDISSESNGSDPFSDGHGHQEYGYADGGQGTAHGRTTSYDAHAVGVATTTNNRRNSWWGNNGEQRESGGSGASGSAYAAGGHRQQASNASLGMMGMGTWRERDRGVNQIKRTPVVTRDIGKPQMQENSLMM